MGNPYKEAERNKKKPPVKAQDTAKKEEKVLDPIVEEEKHEEFSEKPQKKLVKAQENTKKGKGRSLYLSDEVMDALQKEYKKQGFRSASAYLDAIAKDYFGI